MVVDILDVLDELPHIEEFILFSADADFTPVLLRLRERDKRTAALTVGRASAAYKAACDHVIPGELFIQAALGRDIQPEHLAEEGSRIVGGEDRGQRIVPHVTAVGTGGRRLH